MTEILIDPAELEQSASWLRDVTGQLAELSDLGGVCCCEMPPGTGAYVDTELGSAGAMVGEAANGYGVAAEDLATRSALITSDQSLVGAMSSAYGTGAPAVDDTGTASWLSGVSGDGPATDAAGWSPGEWTTAVSGDGPVTVGPTTNTGSWTDAVTGDGSGGDAGVGNIGVTWMDGMSTPTATMSPQTIAALAGMRGGTGSAPSATLAGAFPGILGGGAGEGVGSTMIKLQTALGSTNATIGSGPGLHVNAAGNLVDNANRVTSSISNTQLNPATGNYEVVRS